MAEACPQAPDHTAALDALFMKMAQAENETDARTISNQMWELWTDAPDEAAQALLDRACMPRSSRA